MSAAIKCLLLGLCVLCSARLQSGIAHAQLIAEHVQSTQANLLQSKRAELAAQEAAMYESLLLQAKAEAAAKVYKKDEVKLTMRERLAAKARKEEMLQNSLRQHLVA